MKKLLIIMSLLIFPLKVSADMGAPQVKEYETSVTNVNGAICYKYNCSNSTCSLDAFTKLEYGTTFKVFSEFYFNDEAYVEYVNGANHVDSCYVKVSDLIVINDEYTPDHDDVKRIDDDEYGLYFKTGEVLVDSVDIHSGPSEAYKVVGSIKKGTKLNFLYFHELELGSQSPWLYVNYNGIKGWVCVLDGRIGKKIDRTIINTENMPIYDILPIYVDSRNGKEIATIPAYTEITSYYALDMWSRGSYYVTYNGISGYIYNNDNVVYKEEGEFLTLDDLSAYEVHSNMLNDILKDSKKEITIPKNTKLKVKYVLDFVGVTDCVYYIIEYNNKDYWIIISVYDSDSLDIAEIIDKETTTLTKLPVYETYEDCAKGKKEKTVMTLNNSEKITVLYQVWRNNTYLYISVNGVNGWIIGGSYNDELRDYVYNVDDNFKSIMETNPVNPSKEEEIETPSKIIIEDSKKLTTKEIAYISIGGAIAVSLTALVTIILINKKKKK